MKFLGIASLGVGIIGGVLIAASGRVPDAIAGATVFIGLGIYFLRKTSTSRKK